MSITTSTFRARWIFPVEGEPLENGTVEIVDGRIAAVHDRHDPRAINLGNVALIPGLVNTHTHLELSDIDTPIGPSSPFTAWLRAVIGHRRARSAALPPEQSSRHALVAGGLESDASGSTLVGDIVSSLWSETALPPHRPRIVAFFECLGLRPDQHDAQLAGARRHLQEWSRDANSPRVIRGLSPHAPYSVHPRLYQALVDLAAEFRAPLAVHLAESHGELELLAQGTGEFVQFLQELGVWQPDSIPHGSRPLDYLRPLQALEHALVIHGNYLVADELDFLAGRSNITVVYCPRTHAYFGHTSHPWREMLDRGICVALGTDSRASNPDLSLWNELLFLRTQYPEFDPARLLRLGTLDGAAALGFDSELGTIAPGKAANLAVVALPAVPGTNPYELLFHSQASIRTVNSISPHT